MLINYIVAWVYLFLSEDYADYLNELRLYTVSNK